METVGILTFLTLQALPIARTSEHTMGGRRGSAGPASRQRDQVGSRGGTVVMETCLSQRTTSANDFLGWFFLGRCILAGFGY